MFLFYLFHIDHDSHAFLELSKSNNCQHFFLTSFVLFSEGRIVSFRWNRIWATHISMSLSLLTFQEVRFWELSEWINDLDFSTSIVQYKIGGFSKDIDIKFLLFDGWFKSLDNVAKNIYKNLLNYLQNLIRWNIKYILYIKNIAAESPLRVKESGEQSNSLDPILSWEGWLRGPIIYYQSQISVTLRYSDNAISVFTDGSKVETGTFFLNILCWSGNFCVSEIAKWRQRFSGGDLCNQYSCKEN